MAGFRVISLIGEGAMGSVYLAERTSSGDRVALKLLAPGLARDERFRQRFLRESQLAGGLDDPHIVKTFASGEEDGLLYLAMAFVEGADLRELLRREGDLEPVRALDLLAQVAAALDAAHAAGLVHRDVKPGNILVTGGLPGEVAYVCDFGLARHVSSVSSLTGDRGFVGTIDYVPPEQIEGGPIDGRADVYSLGCVLFECLAGTRPFDRDSELSVVFAHLNEPPPLITDLRPDLPQAFDTVFATALAKSPDDRYSSCGELIDAARAALQGKVVARRRRWRRRRLVIAAVAIAAAAAAIGGVLASQGTHRLTAKLRSIPLTPSALNLIDARTRNVVGRVGFGRRISVGDTWSDVAVAGQSAWVLLGQQQRILRIDRATRSVTGVVKLPWPPGQRIAAGGGSIWVAQDIGPKVLRVDAATGKVAGGFTIRGGVSDGGIAYGDGSVWLSSGPGVVRIDPRNGHVLHRFAISGISGSMRIVFADGAVWAARPGNGAVMKIDPAGNRVTARTSLHGWISDLTVGGGLVWVSVLPDGAVFKLSEDNLGVEGTDSAGADPERISFGGGKLWIANTAARSVSFIDQVSGARQQLASATDPTTALYRNRAVWVSASPALPPLPPIAGEELRISTPTDGPTATDPLHFGLSSQQFLYATCANLLNYPDSAGPDGTRLRPEIAAAMPVVSHGGRTYTFRIRRGFRFSPPSNEPVTAVTFRHTLERALSPKTEFSDAPDLASDIVGASAYRSGKAPHISGVAVHGNTLRITLVKPAGDFLTRISMLSFCPVPLTVPVRANEVSRPIPSAGPYYVSSAQGDRTVLLRNPNYRGDRPRRAQRIVYTNDVPTPKAIALVDGGALDLLPPDFGNTTSLLQPGSVIDRRYGATSAAARAGRQRFFLYQAPLVDYMLFNTRRPLFRDGRLRRAVNYAIDRRALAAAWSDAPADQLVPQAVPGFAAGRIYPIDGPDLAAARRLVGARRRHAVLSYCLKQFPAERRVAELVRSNLARIRIAVSIVEHCPSDGSYDPESERADLLLFTWLEGDDRDPEQFLEQALARSKAFGTALGPGLWTSREFRRRLERARPLRGQARLDAYRRLDDELMRAAPFAVIGNWTWPEFFSPKVGCKIFQAEYGVVDLGALCKSS